MSNLPGLISLFTYYQSLANKTITKTNDDDLFKVASASANSMAIIMKHMAGNMLSRWTDFLTTDGEKPWRHRDTEFEISDTNRDQLLTYWDRGWHCLFQSLNSLKQDDMDKTIFIRGEGQSVEDAIFRQLAHYAYHVGQIVFLGKMFQGEEWVSLSIPKGKSVEYNEKKSAEEKHDGHFTDEWLKK